MGNVRRTDYQDGAFIQYDREAHQLTADLTENGTAKIVTGAASITQTKDSITLTVGGCTITFGAGGITVTGGDVKADGISLKTHVHSGVDTGNGTTKSPS